MIEYELVQSYRLDGHNIDVYETPHGEARFYVDNLVAFYEQDEAEAFVVLDLEGGGQPNEDPYGPLRRWELI